MSENEVAKIGRPAKEPPADAAQRIEALARDGWSKRGIAQALATSHVTLEKWFESDPALVEAFETGREHECRTIYNVLYRAATEKGNIVAAMFILKAKFGWREGTELEAGNRVNITFNLPGALKMDEFLSLKEIVK